MGETAFMVAFGIAVIMSMALMTAVIYVTGNQRDRRSFDIAMKAAQAAQESAQATKAAVALLEKQLNEST